MDSKDEHCTPCAKRLKKDGSPLQDCQCFSTDGDQVDLQCSPIVWVQSLRNIPYHNAIFCVPSTVHSQKPYLGGNVALKLHSTCSHTVSSSN